MVLPFPNEIWLDIFEGLAREGEYDTLERCRVVCKGFRPMAQGYLLWDVAFTSTEEVERIKVDASGGDMRRWRGPQRVNINGGNWKDGRRQIPHLATFTSRFAGRWHFVHELHIAHGVWRARDFDADAVFRDLARFSSITSLYIRDIILPTILTLGRLVCALPCLKELKLFEVQFIQQPFEASTISQFRLLPRTQLETLILDSLPELDSTGLGLRPSIVELVNFIASVSNHKFLFPRTCSTQVYLWSTVRTLHLLRVTFPSVANFARLLCALPSLETLVFHLSPIFAKHGFDPRSIPVHPGLPSRLTTIVLTFAFNMHSDARSVADLVDFFITTGIGHQLQDISTCLSPSLRVKTEYDVSLNRLVRQSGQSLHRLFLESDWHKSESKDVWLPAEQRVYKAPYFDLSENTCLDSLVLAVDVSHETRLRLCTPVVDILSHMTSTHISRIAVRFRPYSLLDSSFDVDWRTLMDGLPQIDNVLSLPIFGNLVHVSIRVVMWGWPDAVHKERADELRACLAKVDERGILGIEMNDIRVGIHWDDETNSWKRYGTERGAARGTLITDEDGDTCVYPCDDSQAVPAALEVASATAIARANAQPPSSSYLIVSRVAAEGCNDGIAPQDALNALETCSGTLQQMSSLISHEPSTPIGFTSIVSRTSNARPDMPIRSEILQRCSSLYASGGEASLSAVSRSTPSTTFR
ncbi:predicted protein [Postia placenta Mad-698-R]|nr:predicted protein [Postia placenta Mad-698-R]